MKKKAIFLLPITIAFGMIFLTLYIKSQIYQTEKLKQFVVLNSDIYYNGQTFAQNDITIQAESLQEQIGYTNTGGQIYAISGLDNEDWLCYRENGKEYVYSNVKKKRIESIKDLSFNRFEIRNYLQLEKNADITEKNIIDVLVSDISDENIVEGELFTKSISEIILYSDNYKGLSYSLLYLTDENDDSYLCDMDLDIVWKLNKSKDVFT